VQTADCVPILLADTKRHAIAAIHAGWRGTLARIAAKTIGRMRMEFGTRAEDISAAMGPCIARCSYEVGPEVAAAFSAQFAQAREWIDVPHELRHGLSDDQFVAGEGPNPLKWLSMMPPGHDPPPPTVQLDLIAANRWQLRDAGVPEKNISDSGLCTACRTDLLFSYRREQGRTGRMLAAIGIRD
jgi:YfiH family protein